LSYACVIFHFGRILRFVILLPSNNLRFSRAKQARKIPTYYQFCPRTMLSWGRQSYSHWYDGLMKKLRCGRSCRNSWKRPRCRWDGKRWYLRRPNQVENKEVGRFMR